MEAKRAKKNPKKGEGNEEEGRNEEGLETAGTRTLGGSSRGGEFPPRLWKKLKFYPQNGPNLAHLVLVGCTLATV